MTVRIVVTALAAALVAQALGLHPPTTGLVGIIAGLLASRDRD